MAWTRTNRAEGMLRPVSLHVVKWAAGFMAVGIPKFPGEEGAFPGEVEAKLDLIAERPPMTAGAARSVALLSNTRSTA